MNENAAISPVSTKQQAYAVYLELQKCVDTNSCGGSNPVALRQIQALVWQLRGTSGPFGEKASKIAYWAAVLYSPRKHAGWRNAHQSGAEAVAHFMRCDLMSLGDIIGRMKDDAEHHSD